MPVPAIPEAHYGTCAEPPGLPGADAGHLDKLATRQSEIDEGFPIAD